MCVSLVLGHLVFVSVCEWGEEGIASEWRVGEKEGGGGGTQLI